MNNSLLRSVSVWVERSGILLVLVALCYGWWFFQMRPRVERSSVFPVASQDTGDEVAPAQMIPSDAFQGLVARRDLFSRPVSAPVASVDSGRLPSQFKLVGVMIDGDPQVIIEDTLLHRTLFIRKSPDASGMKIDRIENGKIFVGYQGKSYSINMKD